MLKAVILEGDTTSHGGKVLEGRDHMTLDGRRIAQIGHKVWCPKCKGVFPIAQGVMHHTFAGVGTAVEGMETACGAILIASQHRMRIEYPRCADGAAASAAAQSAAQGGASTSANAISTQLGAANDEAIQAIDEISGKPIPGQPYRLELSDGTTLRGTTDANGMTQRVASGTKVEILKLYWENESEPDVES